MKVLGIDPHSAKPYGWALVVDGRLERHGTGGLAEVQSLIGPHLDLVAIEDQYLNRSFKVSKALSISAGKVYGVAELAGVPTATVNVASWKSAFGCSKGGGTHVHAVSLAVGEELPDDEASAAGIALYAGGWT